MRLRAIACALVLVALPAAAEESPAPPLEVDGRTGVAQGAPATGEGPGTGSEPGAPAPAWGALEFLGESIEPGTSRRLRFESQDSFVAGLVVARGVAPGPTFCVTAGVHGDELNGVAIARRLVDDTDPRRLSGTLIVVPIVNAYGFRNGSRYLPDRRDLNRYFPGSPDGSAASRIAHQFFENVVRRCEALVDLHTGSLNRTNVPQIRTDLSEVDNLRLAWGFGVEHVVHSAPQSGTLRRAADDAGIPSVLYEAGEPGRIDTKEIGRGVASILDVMGSLGLIEPQGLAPVAQRLYGRTQWVRSDAAGLYVPRVDVGALVEKGQPIAEVTDPFSSERLEIRAPIGGRILGMALGQLVIPGFALFHIGVEDGGPPVASSGPGPAAAPPGEPPASEPDVMRSELANERPE
jgi:predicted deacylase